MSEDNIAIIIVSHKFLTQPDDDLVTYLNERKSENVLHIKHSFHDSLDRISRFIWYKKGKIYKESETNDYKKWPEPLIYIKEFYFSIKWVLASHQPWDKYIGMDGLCVLFGNTLRFFGSVKKTIYWAIDFVPENRFESKFKNSIYHWINKHGYKNSDEMWDLSPRMVDAREKFLGIKKTDYRMRKVVPYGVWGVRIKKYTFEKCEKNTIVFMGHMLEKQGAQLIIQALPKLIKINPKLRYKIIGGGQYQNKLIQLAKDLRVDKYCDFRGKIVDHKVVEQEIAKSCIAVAPYIKRLDTWTYYADPGKVKTYLACGVPVLLTDLPWNAKAIEKSKCGKIISEDQNDIINSIIYLMDKKRNQEYRNNAINFAKSFDYQDMFNNLQL